VLAIDITEFLRNPIRTGIQRVVREILRHWPKEIRKEIVRFNPADRELRRVNPDIVQYCIDRALDPTPADQDSELALLAAIDAGSTERINPGRGDTLLVPELFAALDRVRFYKERIAAGVDFLPIVYDLLAWTDPEALNVPYVGGLNDYLACVFAAPRRSFISHSVRDVFRQRFLRGASAAEDCVMPLGCDSLRRSANVQTRHRPYFICVGALDGRKGQDAVYRAFLASGASRDHEIIFAGKVPREPRLEMLPLIRSDHRGVVVIDDPDDARLASLVQGARASFFVSRHEGFGLPAVESLYLGTPVVVADNLPAVSNLEPHGQIRLKNASEFGIAEAMNALSRGSEAARLRGAIGRLDLQTWERYARGVALWASRIRKN
jgi:glycosyltransferase involved in cell wall biosynthesis